MMMLTAAALSRQDRHPLRDEKLKGRALLLMCTLEEGGAPQVICNFSGFGAGWWQHDAALPPNADRSSSLGHDSGPE